MLFYISIHSLARRLTRIQRKRFRLLHHFNSQPRKEADKEQLDNSLTNGISIHSLARRLTLHCSWLIIQTYISIHSLARRLTPSRIRSSRSSSISIHSLARRLTLIANLVVPILHIFQFTASQGGWRLPWWVLPVYEHFNSQPRKEADFLFALNPLWKSYFNSQPRKEADVHFPSPQTCWFHISIHSLARRLTHYS